MRSPEDFVRASGYEPLHLQWDSRTVEVEVRSLIATLELRNKYDVYDCGGTYEVEATDRHGGRHVEVIAATVIEFAMSSCSGRTVTVDELADQLEPVTHELPVPYAFGHKLRFYAQSVLLVLVALGVASHVKVGRRYVYTVDN